MSACAKIILFGEHSVVYGKKAIAIPVKNLKIKAKMVKYKVYESEHVRYIKDYIINKYRLPNFYLKIYSKIPSASGMGSSAALSIAIAREVKKRFKMINVFDVSTYAEKKAHKNPSGIDQLVILNESTIVYKKGEKCKKKNINLNCYLVISNTNIKGSTKMAVELVKKNKTDEIIENLSDIAEEAEKQIENKNIYEISKLMEKAQENLRKLGVSCDMAEKIINLSSKFALGSKITGAGLGGCVISLCENKEKAILLKNHLKENGVKDSWIVKI